MVPFIIVYNDDDDDDDDLCFTATFVHMVGLMGRATPKVMKRSQR